MLVTIIYLLLLPCFPAFHAPKQPTLLEQPPADPATEALVTYVSIYSTPEGQLAAGMELLNKDISAASKQFYEETSFILEELDQAIELVGDAVVTVLNDEIFEREFQLEDVRGEIQEVMMQLNDATGTCEQYPSCLSCSQDQACIWCTLLGRCVVGDQYGSLNNECQDFAYRDCPSLPCSKYPTCLQCLTDASCAWCELEGVCGTAEELVCEPDFLVREESGGTCPISDEQILASYSTDTPLNVPDTRVDDLQSQLLDLEAAAARLRDQISLLQFSRAVIISAQANAEDIVLSGNYTFAELQGLASSVDVLAITEASLLATVFSSVSVCLVELTRVLEGLQEVTLQDRSAYGQMAAASGKHLNDLGVYHDCNKVAIARYVVFQLLKEPVVVIGLCGPILCEREDYASIIDFILNPPSPPPDTLLNTALLQLPAFHHMYKARALQNVPALDGGVGIHFSRKEVEEKWGTYDGGFYVMLVFVCLLIATSVAGTYFDLKYQLFANKPKKVFEKQMEEINGSINVDESFANMSSSESTELKIPPEPSKPIKALIAFSAYTNLVRLFTPKADKNTLDMFNGIRVLSIGWVVLGHCFLFRVSETAVLNLDEVPERVSYWYSAFIYGAFFAVDTFFWMSGVLCAYLLIDQFRNTERVKWGLIYFHRFVRILPLYMFILFLSWAFSAYIGDGPLWYTFDETQRDCNKYWWTMPLFINNLYLPADESMTCLTGSWYLANDMQFFIISPPLIYLYVKEGRWAGWMLTSFLLGVCILFSSVIAWDLNLNVVPASTEDKYYMSDYYYKPYTRVGPYALGLMCGMIYYSWVKKTDRQEEFDAGAYKVANWLNDSTGLRWLCYALGVTIVNLMIFVQYDQYNDVNWSKWSRSDNAAFLGLSHTLFALGLSFLFLPMLLGNNKMVVSALSADVWTPIARLVFSIFLTHMVIGHIIMKSQPTSYFLEPISVFTDTVSVFLISLVITIPINILTESPVTELEKLLVRRKKTK